MCQENKVDEGRNFGERTRAIFLKIALALTLPFASVSELASVFVNLER
jgi:hypothetical protein